MRWFATDAGRFPTFRKQSTQIAQCCVVFAALIGVAHAQRPSAASPQTDSDRQTETDSASAGQSDSIPPSRTHYMGRQIAQTMSYHGAGWLTRSDRNQEEDSDTMFQQLRIQPGMTVCDMGCGNGYHTLPMARAVGPEGRVLAVDIQPEMLRLMQARAEKRGLRNITLVLGTVVDPHLPSDQSVDLILCVDVYHEFSHPERMLAAMRNALKPNGVVVLVEYRQEDPAVPIKPLHKMSKEQVTKELTANGFRLVRQFDELPWQHMMFFSPTRD